ncbi:unnamed protein product [Sphagnum tenellum]
MSFSCSSSLATKMVAAAAATLITRNDEDDCMEEERTHDRPTDGLRPSEIWDREERFSEADGRTTPISNEHGPRPRRPRPTERPTTSKQADDVMPPPILGSRKEARQPGQNGNTGSSLAGKSFSGRGRLSDGRIITAVFV